MCSKTPGIQAMPTVGVTLHNCSSGPIAFSSSNRLLEPQIETKTKDSGALSAEMLLQARGGRLFVQSSWAGTHGTSQGRRDCKWLHMCTLDFLHCRLLVS